MISLIAFIFSAWRVVQQELSIACQGKPTAGDFWLAEQLTSHHLSTHNSFHQG
jgi:hypothetical protein